MAGPLTAPQDPRVLELVASKSPVLMTLSMQVPIPGLPAHMLQAVGYPF